MPCNHHSNNQNIITHIRCSVLLNPAKHDKRHFTPQTQLPQGIQSPTVAPEIFLFFIFFNKIEQQIQFYLMGSAASTLSRIYFVTCAVFIIYILHVSSEVLSVKG